MQLSGRKFPRSLDPYSRAVSQSGAANTIILVTAILDPPSDTANGRTESWKRNQWKRLGKGSRGRGSTAKPRGIIVIAASHLSSRSSLYPIARCFAGKPIAPTPSLASPFIPPGVHYRSSRRLASLRVLNKATPERLTGMAHKFSANSYTPALLSPP